MVKAIFNTKIQKLAVGQSDQMCQRPKDVFDVMHFGCLLSPEGNYI